MVHTTLLEPYRFPKIVPIEVTVLRGARRLRLSSALRRKYADFVPKIWHIMAKLGYQKYLQKIYVSIDYDAILTSPFYQLPLVLAIFEAVGMLRLPHPIHASGRFYADYSLHFPESSINKEVHSQLFSVATDSGIRLERYLNLMQTELQPWRILKPRLCDLFPGVHFTDSGTIDFTATPFDILKKIPDEEFEQQSLYIPLRRKPLPEAKILLLQRLNLKVAPRLSLKKCFCEHTPCSCTQTELNVHIEQQKLLLGLTRLA